MEIHRHKIRGDRDVVGVRDRARTICRELGFGVAELLQVTTSVFELARNILEHGTKGEIAFILQTEGERMTLTVCGTDEGPGMSEEAIDKVLADETLAAKGNLRGFRAMRRLMDQVEVEPGADGGLIVTMVKHRAGRAKTLASNFVDFLKDRFKGRKAPTATQELRAQNINLAQTLSLYEEKAQELERRNRELRQVKAQLEEANKRLENHTAELQDNLLGLGDETVELAEANQRFYAAVQCMPAPLAITTDEGHVVFANEALLSLLDVDIQDIAERDVGYFLDLLAPYRFSDTDVEALDAWKQEVQAALDRESAWSFELRVSDRGHVTVRVMTLRSQRRSPIGHLWFLT